MNKQIQNIIPLSAIFLFFTFLYAAYLVGLPGTNIGAGQFDRRFLGYVEMLIPIFVAFTFYKMPRFRNPLNLSILWITLIIASILSILSLYPSPYIQQPNLQITKMDMAGMTWFIEMKDQGIGCVYISTPPSRFSDAILGYEKTHLLRPDISGNIVLADHFGYSEQNSLGTQYPLDYYLPITKCDRILYTTVWKNVGRYDNIDFVMLENDSSVSKLYSNDETGIYYIKSTSP